MYNLAKIILLIMLFIFIAALLANNAGSEKSVSEIVPAVVPHLTEGYQENENPETSEQQPPVSGEGDIVDEGVFDGMGQASALDFKRIFGLNAEDYEGMAYFKPLSQMDVEELLIVKVKSDEQMETLQSTVTERIENQKKSFDGYGAAQCALLEKSIVKEKGNFLFYCTSPDAEDYYEAFLDAL